MAYPDASTSTLNCLSSSGLRSTGALVTFAFRLSVALTRLSNFATLRNKIVKNLKIFMEIDHLRSPGVLCQL